MMQYLLDIRADPGFFEKSSNIKWLIIISVAAVAGLVAWFILRRRKSKNP